MDTPNKQRPRTVTLKEAKARLQCGEKFLRRQIKARAIRAIRVNARVILVEVASLDEYERDRAA